MNSKFLKSKFLANTVSLVALITSAQVCHAMDNNLGIKNLYNIVSRFQESVHSDDNISVPEYVTAFNRLIDSFSKNQIFITETLEDEMRRLEVQQYWQPNGDVYLVDYLSSVEEVALNKPYTPKIFKINAINYWTSQYVDYSIINNKLYIHSTTERKEELEYALRTKRVIAAVDWLATIEAN